MLTFTGQKTISSLTRINGYSGNLSQSITMPGFTGYLRPMSETESSANGFQYGTVFSLIIETDVDIQEQDKITIDDIEYTVQGVATHDRGFGTRYKKALINRPQ